MSRNVGGRMASRRAQSARRNRGDKSKRPWHIGLRLKVEDQPVRIHLARPKQPYPDPFDPGRAWLWKVGQTTYIQSKKRMLEWNAEQDLLEAYQNPGKYSLSPPDSVLAEGKWLEQFNYGIYYCISGWVEEWYHLVESDKKDRQGNPYLNRVPCEGKGCKLCKAKVPMVFGNRFWFDAKGGLWRGDFDAIWEQLERQPKDGGYVFPSHYQCTNCHEVLSFYDKKRDDDVVLDVTNSCSRCGADGDQLEIDDETHSVTCGSCGLEWSLLAHDDKTMRWYLDNEHICNNCGAKTYPEPVMVHSDGAEEWETPDIFDCQITLKKGQYVEVDSWKIQEPDPRLFDPQFQGLNDFGEAVAKGQVQQMETLLDLNKVHPQLDPEDQAELLGVPNLFDEVPSQGGSKHRFVRRDEDAEE